MALAGLQLLKALGPVLCRVQRRNQASRNRRLFRLQVFRGPTSTNPDDATQRQADEAEGEIIKIFRATASAAFRQCHHALAINCRGRAQKGQDLPIEGNSVTLYQPDRLADRAAA